MIDINYNKINDRKSYCLSKIISNIMKIPEPNLFYHKGVLDFTLDDYGLIETNIDKKILKTCEKIYNHNFSLKKYPLSKIKSLAKTNYIIGHVKTSQMDYNQVYNHGSEESRHYIEIIDWNYSNRIEIFDHFIPSIPFTTFMGEIEVNEAEF